MSTTINDLRMYEHNTVRNAVATNDYETLYSLANVAKEQNEDDYAEYLLKLAEHAEEEVNNVCEMCGGEGEIGAMEFDYDSMRYQPVGTQVCPCQLDE